MTAERYPNKGGKAEHADAIQAATADNGIELLLTLIADKMTSIENTLNHARMHFDKDEVSGDFVLEHNAWCPAMRRDGGAKFCACGYEDTHDDLREAVAEAEQVRASINAALAKLKGEVAK